MDKSERKPNYILTFFIANVNLLKLKFNKHQGNLWINLEKCPHMNFILNSELKNSTLSGGYRDLNVISYKLIPYVEKF